MRGGRERVRAFEFARVRLSHTVRELLVVIYEQVEIVVHQLEWAVHDVAQQQRSGATVRENDDAAAGRMSGGETHVDAGQERLIVLPRLDAVQDWTQPIARGECTEQCGYVELLVRSGEEVLQVCRRAAHRRLREERRSRRRRPPD